MATQEQGFDVRDVLHRLREYLPHQAPLQDFIHHNTLSPFQGLSFHTALQTASEIFGYTVYMGLEEYRSRYSSGEISTAVVEWVLTRNFQGEMVARWRKAMLSDAYDETRTRRIGTLRKHWKSSLNINLEKHTHPILFRILCSYLDQGIAQWHLPVVEGGLLESVRDLESTSSISLFHTKQVREMLLNNSTLEDILSRLVGKQELYAQYLYDQQFLHPGWSGMVAVLEHSPNTLLEHRPIQLLDVLVLESLLELDYLWYKKGVGAAPLSSVVTTVHPGLFETAEPTEYFRVLSLWQESFEWSYYNHVAVGLQQRAPVKPIAQPVFQALFCIDDRECSFRRHTEFIEPLCETYGTAGFFNMEFYYKPAHSSAITKVCPAPVTPSVVICEQDATKRHQPDTTFNKHSHGFFSGWLLSQTVGFTSAVKLVKNLFAPGESVTMVSSFRHMDKNGSLNIFFDGSQPLVHGLQPGYTVAEMANRFEGLLRSIGLVSTFAPIVYIIGHGASSINNTHYAGYDCGACSGRPGSVNARVAAMIGNRADVRALLRERGIHIPEQTVFIGALHDTTRDEIEYYDTSALHTSATEQHTKNVGTFSKALLLNAKERARRFSLVNDEASELTVHTKMKLRAMSLFEPRPEWNHATNAMCIVGRRREIKHLFLDRRAFLNSYDYQTDPTGQYLLGILNAVAPVCGGINLEYYFSRVDPENLGAGTKLSHNVMGLFGVANGMDGDLRTGLPLQMVNIHDPLRLLLIVEHYPEVLLATIQRNPATYQWFENSWIHLLALHPETKQLYRFTDGVFSTYKPIDTTAVPQAVAQGAIHKSPVQVLQ